MKVGVIFLAALLLIATVPTAMGHAAPPARDFETRALHDHNDDSAYALAGEHGFDSIALDIREGSLATGEDALILRLLLNGGCNPNLPDPCGTLTLDVQFQADQAAKNVVYSTADGGATWTGSANFYSEPMGINDGARFAVEAWVSMESLGIAPGSSLTSFFVDAADRMPEGILAGQPDPLEAAFSIESYTVGSPNFYISAVSPEDIHIHDGEEISLDFTLTNLLVASQVVTLNASQAGVFKLGDQTVQSLELAPGVTKNLTFVAAPKGSGTLTLAAATDLGGYAASQTELKMDAEQPTSVTSPEIASGSSWSYTFVGPGTFSYHDHANPEAGGKIVVIEGNGKANRTITYDGTAFSPADVAVSVGDVVTFQNDGPNPMSIMGNMGEPHDHDDHDHDAPAEGIPSPAIGLLLLGLLLIARRR